MINRFDPNLAQAPAAAAGGIRSFQENFDTLNPLATPRKTYDATGTGGGDVSPSTNAQPNIVPYQTPAAKPLAPAATLPQGYKPNAQAQNAYSFLLNPYGAEAQGAAKGLQGLQAGFQQAAGPDRTFGSTGAAATLQGAYQTGNAAQTEAAKKLVAAKYAGPTALDQVAPQDYEATRAEVSKLADVGRSLGTREGLYGLLSQGAPQLTPGEVNYELPFLRQNAGFRQQNQATQNQLLGLEQNFTGAQTGASAFAAKRAQEESDLAKQSQDYLTNAASGITTGLQGQVTAATAKQKSLDDAFAKFQETGDISHLTKLQGVSAPGISDVASSPGKALLEEAKTVAQSTLTKFQDIKDVPLLVPQVTARGYPAAGWDAQTYAALKAQYSPEELKKIRVRAVERQQALEQAGFSPGPSVTRSPTLEGLDVNNESAQYLAALESMKQQLGTVDPAGKYAGVLPLYQFPGANVGTYSPEDTRSFVTETQGVTPTVENQATGDQRDQFNRAMDILGLSQRMDAPSVAYAPGGLNVDSQNYKTREAATLAGRQSNLTGGLWQWMNAQDAARTADRAKDDVNWSNWKNLGLLVGGPATLGTTWGLFGTGATGPQGFKGNWY